MRFLKGAAIFSLVMASLLAAARGRAGEPTADGAPAALTGIAHADVRVRVILARNGSKKFDPHLADLKSTLDKYNYSSYSLEMDDTIHLQVAETKSMTLLSGKSLNTTLTAITPEKATIRLVLNGQAGQMIDTTVQAGPGKRFFIAGPKYDDGILFLAIEPSYDPANMPGVAKDDNKSHH